MEKSAKLKIYAILFSIALILRIALFFYLYEANGRDFLNPLNQGTDQAEYGRIAINLADNKSFSISQSYPYSPNPARTPVYPFFLSISYFLTGGFFLSTFLNIIIAAFTVLIVFEIGLVTLNNQKPAFWAALVFALLPYNAYLSALTMADVIFTFLFCFFTLAFLKIISGQWQTNIKNFALAGFLLGSTTIVRPITQFFVLVPVFIIFLLLKMELKKKVLFSAAIIFSFIITISPWLIRNKITFGETFLSSVGRYDIFISYVGPWRAYKEGVSRMEKHGEMLDYVESKYGKETMHNIEASTELSKEAKAEIFQNPLGYSLFHFSTAPIYFLNNDFLLTLREAFKIKVPNIFIVQKIMNGDLKGLVSAVFGSNIIFVIIFSLSYLFVILKSVLGLLGGVSYFKKSGAISSFAVLTILYFPAIIGPEGHARFRAPTEPLLLVFFVYFVQSIWFYFKKRNE